MEKHDRIPRDLMRIRVRDLQPGEGTWVMAYTLHVCENGRVFVDLDQHVWPRAFDTWEKEPRRDEFFVQRLEDGWRLHILSRDHVSPRPSDLSKEDREHHALITEVLVHEDKDQVCPTCYGAGIINLTGKMQCAPISISFETMQKIDKALEKLQAFYDEMQDFG